MYGYLQLGEPENVQKYDEAQLRSFWNRQKARPWVLAVSGDFDRDQILAFAKSLPAPDQRKVDVPVPAWGTRPELDIPMPGRNQAHLMLIFKTAPDTSPDTPRWICSKRRSAAWAAPFSVICATSRASATP